MAIYLYDRIMTEGSMVSYDSKWDNLGVKFDDFYLDKVCGEELDRPQLNLLLSRIKPGVFIYIENMPRLSRDRNELYYFCNTLRDRGINVYFVEEDVGIADLLIYF